MKKVILSLLNVFKGDMDEKPDKKDKKSKNNDQNSDQQKNIETHTIRLTNQMMLDEFIAIFNYKLLEMSVGSKMLYPMSFSILIHESDYLQLKDTLHFVASEAVCAFGQIIVKYKDKYPDYQPLACNWHFQISTSKLEKIPVGDNDVIEIKPGTITVMETGIYTFKQDDMDGVTVDNNVRVSLRVNNSDVFKNLNINRDTLLGFDSPAEGVFLFPFDHTFSKTSGSMVAEANVAKQGLAELSYVKAGNTYRFTIKANTTDISGKDELRSGNTIFKIKDSTLINQHLQIKYIPSQKIFQIAAYAPANLNGRPMDISSSNNPLWQELKDGSTIFANHEVRISFKVK